MAQSAELVWVTPKAEEIMIWIARVSSNNQDNPEFAKLLRSCVNRKHWSVFEMASMCVGVDTSRVVTAQMIRHRSFHFQEFSQRYAEVQEFQDIRPRRQHSKDRQMSIDDLPTEVIQWWDMEFEFIKAYSRAFYSAALSKGISKDTARFALPMAARSKIYMAGTVRDWIFYLTVRTEPGVQEEHREVALMVKDIFCKQFPVLSEALGWIGGTDE